MIFSLLSSFVAAVIMSPEINISLPGEALLHWEKKREFKGQPWERRGAGASCTVFTACLSDPDPSQAALLKLSLLELCLHTIRALGNAYVCNVHDKTNDIHIHRVSETCL